MSARQVRRFQLERDVDVSGVSGTGSVAFGAQAPDGTCVLWWSSGLESTTIYPNMETLLAIHGHGGMTRVIYIDPENWDGAAARSGDGDGGLVAAADSLLGGAAAHEADEADEMAADLDEEPARSTARTARGAPRAAAHRPVVRGMNGLLPGEAARPRHSG
jgi:hypothetical protein